MGRGKRVNGNYYKKVFIGKRTIKDGECCGIWNLQGKQKLILGPRLVHIFCSRVTFLQNHFADQNQYLVIVKNDGTTEHKRGPTSIFQNPIDHRSIKVEDAIRLKSGEVLVVNKVNDDLSISQRLVNGPTLLFLEPNESVKSFSWHGEGESKVRFVPNGEKFSVLSTISDQMYYNVQNVRTADNALITIKLLISYQLVDISLMLDKTDDPIGEFIHAVQADVVRFCGTFAFEEFLNETGNFSLLETYPALLSTAKASGFSIHSILYRGYEASEALQKVHDLSLNQRSSLRYDLDEQKQKLEIEANSVKNKLDLLTREQKEEKEKLQHKINLQNKSFQAEISFKKSQLQSAINDNEFQDKVELEYLSELFKRNVKLTPVVCSQYEIVDKQIRLIGNSNSFPAASRLVIE